MINDTFSRTLLTELLNDVDMLIAKAKDGLKGREGSPAVRQFLREVKDKVKKMIGKITDKETKALAESIVTKIEEATKDGSFDDTEEKVRAAIKASAFFPDKVGGQYTDGPYIRDMYPDRCVVSYQGKLYEVSYAFVNNVCVLGQPKEVVEQYVVVTESAHEAAKITDLRESGVNEVAIDFVSLQEAKFNTDFSEVEVVLIEAGVNEHKKRCYPDKTIREAAPIFSGMKMYLNHPTPTQEKEMPERDITKWASTIVESHYDSGKAMGKVAVHDTWLRERLADPVARQHIGLSILAGGKISMGKVNGKEGYQIIEAIIPARKNGPASVDWVTEAGARGRVSKLLESQRKEKSMEYTDITIKDLKESRPDLVAALGKEHAQTKEQADAQAKTAQDLKEANAKIAAFEAEKKLSKQVELVESKLKDAKIPDVVKDRVRSAFKTTVVENIEEAVTGKIKEELDFVNKLTGNGKIKLGGESTQEGGLKESFSKELEQRAGIKEETEKK